MPEALLDTTVVAKYGPRRLRTESRRSVSRELRRRSSGTLSLPPPDPRDLRALGERINEVRQREESHKVRPPYTPLGIAGRFGTEILGAVIAGAAIGWGLDWVFGTRPVFILVMFMFGAAAGILNVFRAAKEINERMMKDQAGKPMPPAVADDEDD